MTTTKLYVKNKSVYAWPLVLLFLFLSVKANAQTNAAASKDYFTIESYYRVKWGFGDEFIDLWKKIITRY